MIFGLFTVLLFGKNASAEIFHEGNTLKFLSEINNPHSEIATYLVREKKLFVIGENTLSQFDFSKPETPKKEKTISFPEEISSVASFENWIALAFPHPGKNPSLQIYSFENDSLRLEFSLNACSGLDMVTFSPNGAYILGACEGEPTENFQDDPEGKILLVARKEKEFRHREISFSELDSTLLLSSGVRNGTPSNFYRSLEPEYIAVSKDSKKAFISLQENNALAVLDLTSEKIEAVFSLGALDHSLLGNSIAFSKGKAIQFENVPLLGLRQPDGIALLEKEGKTYVLTANEGALRKSGEFSDGENFSEKVRRGELDSLAFSRDLQERLSEMKVEKGACLKGASGKCEKVYSFGSRSFSIFEAPSMKLAFDSGDAIEKIIAKVAPDYFGWNAKKKKKKKNARSHFKGPEPETIVVGEVEKIPLTFIGLERASGILTFDLRDIHQPKFLDFWFNPKYRGPEGMIFIAENESPTKKPLLVVCFEYSGTIAVFEVKKP